MTKFIRNIFSVTKFIRNKVYSNISLPNVLYNKIGHFLCKDGTSAVTVSDNTDAESRQFVTPLMQVPFPIYMQIRRKKLFMFFDESPLQNTEGI